MSKFTWGQSYKTYRTCGKTKFVSAVRIPLTLHRDGKEDLHRLTWIGAQDPDLEINLMPNSEWRRQQEKLLLNKAAELG